MFLESTTFLFRVCCGWPCAWRTGADRSMMETGKGTSMTSIESTVNHDASTLTVVVEFDAERERVFEVWQNPRLLERWWGPPTWPATFVEHDLVSGAQSSYFMTGPDGEKESGLWRLTEVDPPRSLTFLDAFATAEGEVDESMPTSIMHVTFEELESGGGPRSRMTNVTTLQSRADLEQMLAMGMREGMELAIGQIEGILRA
jgi:uncharacterized protein YndB with AHSA1/START domain